jgi:hypothetical protein
LLKGKKIKEEDCFKIIKSEWLEIGLKVGFEDFIKDAIFQVKFLKIKLLKNNIPLPKDIQKRQIEFLKRKNLREKYNYTCEIVANYVVDSYIYEIESKTTITNQ